MRVFGHLSTRGLKKAGGGSRWAWRRAGDQDLQPQDQDRRRVEKKQIPHDKKQLESGALILTMVYRGLDKGIDKLIKSGPALCQDIENHY
jgi:hypothetical protein